MNPIIANLNRNNIVNQALSMRNPDALYQKMINDNPQFRKFVDENKGKTPQEIAQYYGVDPALISQFCK